MSNSYGRETVHFEFYLWNRQDPYNQPSGSLAGYQTILQMLVSEIGGLKHIMGTKKCNFKYDLVLERQVQLSVTLGEKW